MTRRRAPDWWTVPLRTAGPPGPWYLIAGVVTIAIGAGLAAAHLWHPVTAAFVATLVFAVLGLADRDALTIRLAVLEYARLVGAGRPDGFPTNPEEAVSWLADPARAEASPLVRATILAGLGRRDEARAVLDGFEPDSSGDRARAAILRLTLEPATDRAPEAAARDAVAALATPERRGQSLALAVAVLNRDLSAGRPWRPAFLEAVRPLGPFALTARGWFLVATQQLPGACVFGIAFLLLLAITVVASVRPH